MVKLCICNTPHTVKKLRYILKSITDISTGILKNIKVTHRKDRKAKQQELENKSNTIKGIQQKNN